MDKTYNHNAHEEEVYERWEVSGGFTPPPTAEARERGLEPYCIIMPPPNANDPLHVGHAMFVTVEDILIRYQRMRGKAALWLPGTDHAGIETQYVFEKKLNKEGKSRFNFDRETLYQMIWDYVQENSGTAIAQMKRLGASADWSRTKFTLEPEIVDLVLNTFEKMHEKGLVYRGQQLVNYCTKCGTGYSELEVKHEERKDALYYVAYELVGDGEPVVVATGRPETIFADVAIAIHPEHKRAEELRGKRVINPLTGREMPMIEDEVVELEFGTGMLKITPGHDQTDFEVGARHDLEILQAVGLDGKLTEIAGEYKGVQVDEARKKVVEQLEAQGSLVKVDENYQHNIGVCYRCGRVIEPLPMTQFFIKVKGLTEAALKALDEGRVKVYGAGHGKILKHWLTNLRDWNISRQIVWGIRLPIWYQIGKKAKSKQQEAKVPTKMQNEAIVVGFLDEEGRFVQGEIGELLEEYPFELIEKKLQTLMAPKGAEYVVSREKPDEEGLWLQETDTFDTWFSSSQWPVVTLKTSHENVAGKAKSTQDKLEDFEYYYPTSVMETAYDILPFWVMRMLMMGLYLTGEVPFEKVYFHGLVRDEKGQKMSKSKGNVINPLELVDKYGADALRMALVMSTTAGRDSAMGESKVRGMRNFGNKIWNASRFIKMNLEISNDKVQSSNEAQNSNTKESELDKMFSERLNQVVGQVTGELEGLRIGQAAETVHNEFWHWFCDECIEAAKKGELSPTLLTKGLKSFLVMLHPFMPFVTEVVWRELGWERGEGLLMLKEWPKVD